MQCAVEFRGKDTPSSKGHHLRFTIRDRQAVDWEGVDETTPGSADAREAGKCSSDETEESGGNTAESALMV